ncbi:MAG: HEAT repeat domain-containing protein [Bryobacteraceae bacterium]|jgi:hypothetical protein
MSCDLVAKLIPLYYYGELPPEEAERLEEHLRACAGCARELERQRGLAAALDLRQREVPPGLLEECRADLMASVRNVAHGVARQPAKGRWTRFLEAVSAARGGFGRLRQPVGALALVAVGFFAARYTAKGPGAPLAPASPAETYATVRSVQPDNAGGVRIAYDQTQRREIAGPVDNQGILNLLLAASRGDNPAVRMESVDLLKGRAESSGVLDALLNAFTHDPNAAVRLKALEGLGPLSGDPRVRQTMAGALESDDNPVVRMQVVDTLVAHPDNSMVGMFQGLVQRDTDGSVRQKYEKALKDRNASIGTF